MGRWIYDHESEQTLESLFGVEYDSCCWMIRAVTQRALKPVGTTIGSTINSTDLEADSGLFLQIQLKGLGNLDSSADTLLQDAIPGYLTRENNREKTRD